MNTNDEILNQHSEEDKNPEFLQDFIDRKKLQNRVLGEIIDHIIQSGSVPESN